MRHFRQRLVICLESRTQRLRIFRAASWIKGKRGSKVWMFGEMRFSEVAIMDPSWNGHWEGIRLRGPVLEAPAASRPLRIPRPGLVAHLIAVVGCREHSDAPTSGLHVVSSHKLIPRPLIPASRLFLLFFSTCALPWESSAMGEY